MASLDFPVSPNNGDTYTLNNVSYVYNGDKGVWLATSNTITGQFGPVVTVSNTSPTGAISEGELYWDEDLGKLFIYYNDGDTNQWVEASPTHTLNRFEFYKSVAGSPTELYRFESGLFRGAKITVALSDSPNFKVQEIYVVHDGTDASISNPYLTDNEASIGTMAVTYSANIADGNVRVYATATSGSPVARGEVNLIGI